MADRLRTLDEVRMCMKILKDAGVVPAEVEWFHERARLRQALEAADPAETEALRVKLVALEQKISLRLESLRANAKI